jgi:hypothetical protein
LHVFLGTIGPFQALADNPAINLEAALFHETFDRDGAQ